MAKTHKVTPVFLSRFEEWPQPAGGSSGMTIQDMTLSWDGGLGCAADDA